jgi:hypothetical protein
MLGLQDETLLASSTVFGYPIWWLQNRKFIFSSCFYVRQAQIHILLGYKRYFGDQIHVFGVGELNGAIKQAP